MRHFFLVIMLTAMGGCHFFAPVEAPINSCRLVSSDKQSGGMLPGTDEEFNQCKYRCPNGTTRHRTRFGSCPVFLSVDVQNNQLDLMS